MLYAPVVLHIPESFLNLAVASVCWVVTALTLGVAISKTNKSLGEKQIPLMGIMAAFIFAAQMINFPIVGGTSGHLLGGVLAAVVLGPWSAMLAMTAVIALQALLFQDGGLSVMGANILNMGIITAAIGYGLYRTVAGRPKSVKLAVIGFAAWLSVMASALFTSLEIWLSGNADLRIIIPVMLSIHALIGLGEAVITVAALSFIMQTRPDLLGDGSESEKGGRGWIWAGIGITLLVLFLSPFASADPDGLERVAIDLGFMSKAGSAPFKLLPDYTVPFLGNTPLSTVAAGLVGAVIVGFVVVLIAKGMRTGRNS